MLQPPRERTNDSKARLATHSIGIGRPTYVGMYLVEVPSTKYSPRAGNSVCTTTVWTKGAANEQENDPGFSRAWPEAAGSRISSLFHEGR